ncbi:alpha/beta hydrolase [Rhodoferax lacus]|uniref:Alpha/beta hydrolase n=1 Tax=Rhodoferax lacus TaxID=2184758 RepID=A0A3E1REC0_9BURK|nr:alpha/beta hydrolase [Rhodoferax lacus]RFO97716.1 alpha/beta hydrolase [Rhodoferax lacus]
MYQVQVSPKSECVPLRGLNYHVQVWGTPAVGRTPLVMVHGWMDVAASYQFVVDALAADYYVIAPDWRGFGLTEVPLADHFVFADYLGDLDFLLDHYCPEQPVNLVGHSMGGNIAMLYAGVRPERVRRLINLEGFGMPRTVPAQAPGRYARWMDELKGLHQGQREMRGYASLEDVAHRLMKTNPRLDPAKAEWLAGHWARQNASGQWQILGHAAHRLSSAQLYRVDETLEIFKAITAPTLCVEATDSDMGGFWKGAYSLPEFHERLQAVPQCTVAQIAEAGHMLHHDQPEQVAALIEQFIA